MSIDKLHINQRGFFDLGLSLVLLAVFSTTAAYVTPDNKYQDKNKPIACYSGQDSMKQGVIVCNYI